MSLYIENIVSHLDELRERCSRLTLPDVFENDASARALVEATEAHMQGQLHVAVRYGAEIVAALKSAGCATDLDAFASVHFEHPLAAKWALLDVLAYAFQLPIGPIWRTGIVTERCPDIVVDDDGLAQQEAGIIFGKDGAYINDHQVWYHSALTRWGLSLSGGFLEDLVRVSGVVPTRRFGLRLSHDVVVPKAAIRRYVTKAYIRGPKGISEALLCDPRFPESASGTVSQHMRVQEGSIGAVKNLARVEVMWSSRDAVKSVQIEEVLTPSQREAVCRYVHAQWDPSVRAIVHFDGAVRTYNAEASHERFGVDIKSAARADSYTKVFRIDAQLKLADWQRLVVKFFHDNELVMEYFGGAVDGSG